ncbi:MAG: hypothetical protein QOI90_1911 [Mycobacterium sp.]|nr:hypothetical protein [Mycobacterium sp.]
MPEEASAAPALAGWISRTCGSGVALATAVARDGVPTGTAPIATVTFAAARRWSDGPSSRRVDREGYGDHVFADADGSFATGGGQVRGRHFSGMIPDYDGVEGVHRACE